MNYKTLLNSTKLIYNNNFVPSKKIIAKTIKKKDFVSIGFHDYEKEEIRLEQFDGQCIKFRSAGLNSKLTLYSKFRKSTIKLNFFLYSPHIFDIIKHTDSNYKKLVEIKEKNHPEYIYLKKNKAMAVGFKPRRNTSFFYFPKAAYPWYREDEEIWSPVPPLPCDARFYKAKEEEAWRYFYFRNKKWRKKIRKK